MNDRIAQLREVVASIGADAAVVSHHANRQYFSGFPAADHAPDESYGVLLVTGEHAVLYTSETNLPWAESSVHAPVVARAWGRPWPAFVAEQVQEAGATTLAFEDRALTVADHAAMLAAVEGIAFTPAGNAFHAVRAIKDDRELDSIAKAAGITDAAFLAATTKLVAGVTERELAWRIELAMRELGADGPAFPTSVAAGPHGARPHHDPSERPILEGEPVVIDMGAMVGGYCADLTRTICLGQPSPEFSARYTMVLAAQSAALSGIRAGMTGREADAIARESLASAGFEELFVHGLGHGVGLLIHEYPSLGKSSEDLLEPGHVVSVEPGIYLEGWGGIRIEDLCVVTADGLDILSNAPK